MIGEHDNAHAKDGAHLTESPDHVINSILGKSRLARNLRTIYSSLYESGKVQIVIGGWISVAFCSVVDEIPMSSFLQPIHDRDQIPIKPYHTLLLRNTADHLLWRLPSDCSSSLYHLVQCASPLKNFEELAQEIDAPLAQVIGLAKHLISWHEATIIYPICGNNTYVVAPDFDLDLISEENRAAFATSFNHRQTLITVLIDFSHPRRLSEHMNPVSDSKESIAEKLQVVQWLLQREMVILLQTYVFLVVPSTEMLSKIDGVGLTTESSTHFSSFPRFNGMRKMPRVRTYSDNVTMDKNRDQIENNSTVKHITSASDSKDGFTCAVSLINIGASSAPSAGITFRKSNGSPGIRPEIQAGSLSSDSVVSQMHDDSEDLHDGDSLTQVKIADTSTMQPFINTTANKIPDKNDKNFDIKKMKEDKNHSASIKTSERVGFDPAPNAPNALQKGKTDTSNLSGRFTVASMLIEDDSLEHFDSEDSDSCIILKLDNDSNDGRNESIINVCSVTSDARLLPFVTDDSWFENPTLSEETVSIIDTEEKELSIHRDTNTLDLMSDPGMVTSVLEEDDMEVERILDQDETDVADEVPTTAGKELCGLNELENIHNTRGIPEERIQPSQGKLFKSNNAINTIDAYTNEKLQIGTDKKETMLPTDGIVEAILPESLTNKKVVPDSILVQDLNIENVILFDRDTSNNSLAAVSGDQGRDNGASTYQEEVPTRAPKASTEILNENDDQDNEVSIANLEIDEHPPFDYLTSYEYNTICKIGKDVPLEEVDTFLRLCRY